MILALETANDLCSVVLYDDTGVIARRFEAERKEQTRLLLPMIDSVLAEAAIQLQELNAIAFSRGPGSFSGIRINAAVTQALAWTHDLPVIAVSTLQATAQRALTTQGLLDVTVVLDARMNEVYTARFKWDEEAQVMMPFGLDDDLDIADHTDALVAYPALDEVDLTGSVIVGSGAHLVAKNQTVHRDTHIAAEATDVAQIAWHLQKKGQTLKADQALPVYLRDDAWKKLDAQRAYTAQKAADAFASK